MKNKIPDSELSNQANKKDTYSSSSRLIGMEDTKVKKLNKYSSDINYIGIGSILYATGMMIHIYIRFIESSSISTWQILVFLYFCTSIYACFARPVWGDIIGFFSSIIFLFAFPIGTIFGILGMRAIINSNKLLFGNERITDTELSEAAATIERQSS